jgi:hypothetical protein
MDEQLFGRHRGKGGLILVLGHRERSPLSPGVFEVLGLLAVTIISPIAGSSRFLRNSANPRRSALRPVVQLPASTGLHRGVQADPKPLTSGGIRSLRFRSGAEIRSAIRRLDVVCVVVCAVVCAVI